MDNVTTKLDAPYTLFTIRARSMAPYGEEASDFDVRSRDRDCKKATNSQVNYTSAAKARMSAANRGSAKVSFWNGITRRLQSLSLDVPKIGAISVRPFATDSHHYSQTEPGKSQEALLEAEAEAEAASLEKQLQNLQIPTVAFDDVDESSAGFAEKIAKLGPRLRALRPNPSKSKDSEAQVPSRGRVRLRVVRSQKRRTPMEQSRIRYVQRGLKRYIPTKSVVTRSSVAADEKPQAKPGVEDQEPHGGQKYFRQVTSQPLFRKHISKDEERLPSPVDMLFRKMNAESAENNASESQLDNGKYHKTKAEETKNSRGTRKDAIDPVSPIRFISDPETENAHIEVPNRLGSELSVKTIEQGVERIEIRRHLSFGQAPKLPFTVRRIRRVPTLHVSKHAVAEKTVTTPEGNLLIRKHGVGSRSQERPNDLSHSTSASETQERPGSPRDQARELHRKYGFTSLHDHSPEKTQKYREQYFTFHKHKSDAKLPIFVKGSG